LFRIARNLSVNFLSRRKHQIWGRIDSRHHFAVRYIGKLSVYLSPTLFNLSAALIVHEKHLIAALHTADGGKHRPSVSSI
jgi:hypothetical protein